MKYEKFDLEKAKEGRIIGIIKKGEFIEAMDWKYFETSSDNYPIVAIINGDQDTYTKSGDQYICNPEAGKQLVMKPEETVSYANLYKDNSIRHSHKSLEEAKADALKSCLGQIKITIIGDDFIVEKV